MNIKKLLANISIIIFGLCNISLLNYFALANEKPTVALVLSGGGSRGIAHIGMLKYFEDNNIKIDYIVGTSIGAIIGGLYSAGYSADQIDSIFTNADWQEIFKLQTQNKRENVFFNQKKIIDRSILTLRFNNFKLIPPEAISDGTVLNNFFQTYITNSEYFYVNNFDSLKIPFRAVATDLAGGQSVALKSGNLARAIRASSTLPVNYAPVKIDEMILVDGGIMANIPVRFAKEFQPDIIIAMDATSAIHLPEVLNTPLKIVDQIISITMEHFAQTDAKLADIVIVPQIENQSYLDFSNVKELVNIGYNATKEVFDNIIFDTVIASETKQSIQILKEIATHSARNDSENNKQIIISKIEVFYNKTHSPNLISENFPVKIGDTLTSEKLALSYSYLEKKNKFDDIDIQIISQPNRHSELASESPENNQETLKRVQGDSVEFENILQINLHEISNQTLRFTGRLDNERTVQLGIDFVTKNIFSTNLINQISLIGSGNSRDVSINFLNPQIFNQNISMIFSAYYQWKDINIYDWITTPNSIKSEIIDTNYIRRRGVRAAFAGNIENNGLLGVEYRFENQTYGFVENNDGAVNRENISNDDFVSLVGFSFYYDSENSPFFATDGQIINILLETNLFSTNLYSQFSKLSVFMKTNLNFGKHNLAPSLFFGGADRTLPYPEFFSLGGQDNFFGMREYEEVGRQIFRTSFDYRYELPSYLSVLNMKSFASLRYDFGSVWEMPEQIKLSTLKHGIGSSISLDTPIGPAVFSIGRSFSFLRMNRETLHIQWSDFLVYFRLGMKL